MASNNEFIKLYYALNKAEQKQFTNYVKKDYELGGTSISSNGKGVTKQLSFKERNLAILQYLKNTDGDIEKFNRDKLNKKLKLSLTDPKPLGNQMSSLFKKCREWFILEACNEKDNDDVDLLLLKIFKKKNLAEEGYYKWNNKVRNQLDKLPYRDIHYHYHSWLRTHLSFFRASEKQLEGHKKDEGLNKAEAELDAFYALAKLRYHYERIAVGRLKNASNNEFSKSDIDSFSQQQLAAPFPLIRFYANIIQAELSNNNSFYDTALEILTTYDHQVSPAEIPAYYVCLYNYAGKKFNEENGIERIFNLQVLGLERDWITGGGQLTVNLFNTLVNTGCLLGKTELVKDIIKNYSSRLPQEQRKSCQRTAEARVLFQEKKYKEAWHILMETPYDFELAFISVQSLLIRCCYELGGDYLFESKSHCTNLRRNIHKKENLSGEIKARVLNFTAITLMFFHKSPDWKKISLKIEKTQELICRDWLLEKVKEKLV